MSSLFGGSKSKSSNQAYGQIKDWASPLLGYTQQGASGLSALLGGDTSGLDAYKSAMGYDWELGQQTGDLLAKQAAIGGLDSGATLKGLQNRQTQLNSTYGQNYLQSLLGLSGIGTDAAGTLAGAGSTSTSKTSPNIVGTIGSIGSSVAKGGF